MKRFLNHFAALPSDLRRKVRSKIIADLQSCAIEDDSFVSLSEVTLHIPFEIGGFSDFYCSLEHSNNVNGHRTPLNILMFYLLLMNHCLTLLLYIVRSHVFRCHSEELVLLSLGL